MATRLDHWLRFLPEAGTVTLLATEIEEMESDLRHHAAEVKRLRAALKRKEKKAVARALKNWSDQDIMSARLAAISPEKKKGDTQ